jgi:hypothetical protein
VLAVAVIALVISAIGLTVSIAVAVRVERREGRRDERLVSVTCRPGAPLHPQPGLPTRVISVRAVNQGHRPVELRAVQFLTDGGDYFWRPKAGGDEVPKRISDGESLNVHFDANVIEREAAAAGVQLTHAIVADADANIYAAPYPATGA